MNAVILDYQSLAPADLDLSALKALPLHWTFYDYTQPHQVAERIQDAQVVLSNKVVLDADMLKANRQLRLIIIMATGTNNVAIEAATAQGIQVSNIRAYSTESVVQHTFASLLSLSNHLKSYDQAVKDGHWFNSQSFTFLAYPISELAGKTLGIIGYGAIGRRVAEVAKAFSMRVMVAQSRLSSNQNAGRTPLDEVLQQSDVLSIHAPLSPLTANLIDEKALALMKKTAILLNLGRGGIVNEQALLNALENHTIAAAALDVLSQEPPAKEHALIAYQKPNLLITPHIAWASREARQELISQVCAIVTGFGQGKAINQVML